MTGQPSTGLGSRPGDVASPAGRVLTLLERVQERPGRTVVAHAGELGVTERTVRRYVAVLQDLGIPVVAQRGRGGGLRLEAGFRMPPLMLTTDEAVALTLTLAVLGDADDATSTTVALGKLRRALPRDVAGRVDDVLAAVRPGSRTGPLAPDAAPRPALLAALAGAVVAGRTCRIRHRTTSDVVQRAVDPYGVVVVRGRLYLHGWCHLRRARRTFRVDRIEAVETLDATFRAPGGLDVADAVETSLATSWEGWRVSVLLAADLATVAAHVPRYVAVPEAVDEHTTRLRLTTRNLDATVVRLSDHPFPMTVEEPAELREAFARRAAWMRDVAQSG